MNTHKTFVLFGKVCFTFCKQPGGAPILDGGVVVEDPEYGSRQWNAKVLLLTEWFKKKRDRKPGLALVIGWPRG